MNIKIAIGLLVREILRKSLISIELRIIILMVVFVFLCGGAYSFYILNYISWHTLLIMVFGIYIFGGVSCFIIGAEKVYMEMYDK